MAPEIKKAAESYVRAQVAAFSKRPPKKQVQQAIRKVAEVLEEVRIAQARTRKLA